MSNRHSSVSLFVGPMASVGYTPASGSPNLSFIDLRVEGTLDLSGFDGSVTVTNNLNVTSGLLKLKNGNILANTIIGKPNVQCSSENGKNSFFFSG